jgi:hypothetical protein
MLHANHLKARGFRRTSGTFSRSSGSFIESFNLQGSPWNSGEEPWEFYLNVLVTIPNVPPIPGATKGYNFHASGRSNSILAETPPRFEVTAKTVPIVVDELALIIHRISEILPSLVPPVIPRAKSGLNTPLPAPAWALEPDAANYVSKPTAGT